jgi:hypothetical protein
MANNGPQVVTSSAEERDEGHCAGSDDHPVDAEYQENERLRTG